MLNKLLGLAVIAVSFVSTAHAKELSAATHHHYLLGHWSCIGHVDTPDGERFNTVGSWKIKRAFYGHVYDRFENYTGSGFVYKAKGVTSYDKLAGVLNRHVISSMGSWTRYVSAGWKGGDTLTWEGESHRFGHPTTGIEQIITKKDDNSFELAIRVHGEGHHGDKDGKGDSGWQDMYTGTCTRDGGHDGHKDDGNKDDDSVGKTQQGAGDDIADEDLDEAL